jgi:hypothetical protein
VDASSLSARSRRPAELSTFLSPERSIMKRLIETQDDGLESLIGETVTFFCLNYIYTGRLVGVNETCVLLSEPKIVYETGAFTTDMWQDAQELPHDLYVMIAAIESYGIMK